MLEKQDEDLHLRVAKKLKAQAKKEAKKRKISLSSLMKIALINELKRKDGDETRD